jgi:hypothetical protein
MNTKQRAITFARQRGISTVGATKNATALNRLIGRLTPRQQRRIRQKANRAMSPTI